MRFQNAVIYEKLDIKCRIAQDRTALTDFLRYKRLLRSCSITHGSEVWII